MAVERGLSHNEGVLIQPPPPFSPKIELPPIIPIESQTRAEVSHRLSEVPSTEGKTEEPPLEVRTFRFWQKSLWRNEQFRKATKGRGFMQKDLNVQIRIIGGLIMNVMYNRNGTMEILDIETRRIVRGQELDEIRYVYGEEKAKKEAEIVEETFRKKKPYDGTIESAVVKHEIQLIISSMEGMSSTYLSIQRYIIRNKIPLLDHTFNFVEGMDDQATKKFVGWLAIAFFQ